MKKETWEEIYQQMKDIIEEYEMKLTTKDFHRMEIEDLQLAIESFNQVRDLLLEKKGANGSNISIMNLNFDHMKTYMLIIENIKLMDAYLKKYKERLEKLKIKLELKKYGKQKQD